MRVDEDTGTVPLRRMVEKRNYEKIRQAGIVAEWMKDRISKIKSFGMWVVDLCQETQIGMMASKGRTDGGIAKLVTESVMESHIVGVLVQT